MIVLSVISGLLLAELGVKIVSKITGSNFTSRLHTKGTKSGHSQMGRAWTFHLVRRFRTEKVDACVEHRLYCIGLVGCILTGKDNSSVPK